MSQYYQEMQVLMICTGIRESVETTMTRFFKGANDDVTKPGGFDAIQHHARSTSPSGAY